MPTSIKQNPVNHLPVLNRQWSIGTVDTALDIDAVVTGGVKRVHVNAGNTAAVVRLRWFITGDTPAAVTTNINGASTESQEIAFSPSDGLTLDMAALAPGSDGKFIIELRALGGSAVNAAVTCW